jgi:hypothetical protein
VFALSSLVELALEADDLRHGHALERQENFVRLGIHTLDLALVVVIISYLDTEKVSVQVLAPAKMCAADQDHHLPR